MLILYIVKWKSLWSTTIGNFYRQDLEGVFRGYHFQECLRGIYLLRTKKSLNNRNIEGALKNIDLKIRSGSQQRVFLNIRF